MPPTPPPTNVPPPPDNPPIIDIPDWMRSGEDNTVQRPPDVNIDDLLPPRPPAPPGQRPPDTDIGGLLPPIGGGGDQTPPVLPDIPDFWPEEPSLPEDLPEVDLDWPANGAMAPNAQQQNVDRPSWWRW